MANFPFSEEFKVVNVPKSYWANAPLSKHQDLNSFTVILHEGHSIGLANNTNSYKWLWITDSMKLTNTIRSDGVWRKKRTITLHTLSQDFIMILIIAYYELFSYWQSSVYLSYLFGYKIRFFYSINYPNMVNHDSHVKFSF